MAAIYKWLVHRLVGYSLGLIREVNKGDQTMGLDKLVVPHLEFMRLKRKVIKVNA